MRGTNWGRVRSRNLTLYYVGMLTGDVAYQVQAVAVAWHIFQLHHQALDLGLVGLALFVPTLVLALPAGVLADRLDRRLTVSITASSEAVFVALFVLAIVNGITATAPYFAILVLIGTARAFGTPAERALLPTIVTSDRFIRAQATYSTFRQFTVIGGPALGGLLVAISTQFALGSCVALLAISAIFIRALRIERPDAPKPPPPSLHEALEGVRFIRSVPELAGAISLDLFAVLFGGATALLPAFADAFHAGPHGLGLLRSAPAVGSALVAATIARKPLERRIGPVMFACVAIFGIATIAFGLSHNFVFSLAMLALAGGADMVSVVIRSGLVQLGTPEAMRGRVLAVENVFIGASNELGAFESGAFAALVGVVPSVVIGGIGTLVVIAVWAGMFPALRSADRFPLTTGRHGAPS